MRLFTRLAARLRETRRRRLAMHGVASDRARCVALPEVMRAALKPDQQTWLIARAVSLWAF